MAGSWFARGRQSQLKQLDRRKTELRGHEPGACAQQIPTGPTTTELDRGLDTTALFPACVSFGRRSCTNTTLHGFAQAPVHLATCHGQGLGSDPDSPRVCLFLVLAACMNVGKCSEKFRYSSHMHTQSKQGLIVQDVYAPAGIREQRRQLVCS